MDTWRMIEAERTELAGFGETLDDPQWDAPSLCEGWKVRHVFAHVLGGTRDSMTSLLPALFKSGLNVNKALARSAIEAGDRTLPEVMVKELRANADSRKLPPGIKAIGMLADAVVHTQDIRRALGTPRTIPEPRLRAVLDHMVRTGSVLGNKKRVAGMRLVATDLDWVHGAGPEARGPAEALLMVTCGRRAALDDVDGPGAEVLRSRLR